MKTKVLQVFYNENGLPFKDQERTVHFPIIGSGFMGASNTTQIKFYFKEIGDDAVKYVAVSKLPNGKVGSKVLENYFDTELNEPYALLELDSYYTQYKGDLFISLQGYQGGVQVNYNEDTELYEIEGTPTIQATGSIKFTNNYATQFVGSGEEQNITLQQLLAIISDTVLRYYVNSNSTLAEVFNEIGTKICAVDIEGDEYLCEMSGDTNIVLYDIHNQEWYAFSGANTTTIDSVLQDSNKQIIATKEDLENFGNLFTYKGTASVSEINALTNIGNGWCYNLTDSGTLTLGNLQVETGDNVAFDGTIWTKLSSETVLGQYYTKEEGQAFEQDVNNQIDAIENQVQQVASGSPKGVYATLSDLQNAYPTGTTGIYVVSGTGHWYYWNGSAWADGGSYQAAELSDYEQQTLRTSIINNKILNDGNDYYNLIFTRGTIAGSGTFYSSTINFRSTAYIYNSDSFQKQYRISIPAGCQLVRWEYTAPQTAGGGATNATTYNDTDKVMVINASKYAYFVLKHADGSTQVTEQELNSLLIYNDNVNDVFNYNKEDKNIIVKQDSELSLRLFKNYNLQFKRGTIAGGSEWHSLTNFVSTPRLHITETHMVTMKADDNVTAVFYRATTATGGYAAAQSLKNGGTIVLMPNFYYTVVLTNGSTLTVDDLFKISFIEFYNEKFETLYKTNEETLINAINNELDGNKIIFGLITDMHYGQSIYYDNVIHQIDIINNISNKVGASFNINLGDAYMNSDDTSANFEMLSEVMKRNKSSFVPWLYCKGNHENFVISGGGLALEDSQIKALTNRFNKWIGKTPLNSLYYYYDINNCRFIVLDSSSNTNNGFSNEQITFLTNALANLGDKKAVVFTHIPPSSQLTSTGEPINSSNIRSILENNASSIIAVFYGHVHFDNYTEINGVKYIGTCCALPVKVTIPAGISGNPTVYDRNPLDYTQYCFDFVIIDTDTKDIAIKRFGVGNNRQYSGR